MRCKYCDYEPIDEDPNFCPECGKEFARKTTEDVDWPLRINVGPRFNIHRLVSEETGIDQGDALWEFHDDVEILFYLRVHKDGSVEMEGESR